MTTDPNASSGSEVDVAPRRRRRFDMTDIALIAAFAALISACAYIGAIPVGGTGVPITLQTFAVMLTGCVLGPARGFATVVLYLVLGAVGLPVFAEHSSGLGAFTGPSAGYLLSFPVAAFVAGFGVAYVARSRRARALVVFGCSFAGSVLVIHPMGIVGMKIFFDVSFTEAVAYDLPFWIGDVLKTALVALIAAEVHRAFPRLLQRPAQSAAAGTAPSSTATSTTTTTTTAGTTAPGTTTRGTNTRGTSTRGTTAPGTDAH